MKILIRILSIFLVLVSLILLGCSDEPLPIPAPPTTVSGAEETDISSVDIPTIEDEPVEEAGETPSEDFILISDTANIEFPDRIVFSLVCTSQTDIEEIILHYRNNEHVTVSQKNEIEVSFDDPGEIDISWNLEMKKLGWIPPGATFWWNWELIDINGNHHSLSEQELVYSDTRYEWECHEVAGMDIYWKSKDNALLDELLVNLEDKISRVELPVNIPEERKIKVFVYENTEELKGAVIQEQQWIGALAATTFNTILIPVNAMNLEWAQDAIAHEVTHLIVHEIMFGPFGNMPTWLSEGLAMYSEGKLDTSLQYLMVTAYQEGNLLSFSSLAGTFPADVNQASLAYAQSGNVVTYLIDQYDWEKMSELLAVLKTGSNIENALIEVYGMNLQDLQTNWEHYLSTKII